MMTTPCPPEWPQTGGHEQTKNSLPLLQRDRNVSIISEHDSASSTTSAAPSMTSRRRSQQGPSNSLCMYHEQLIDLFWVQDLPLREVQEIMRREHGLDASTKVYKSQFRKWGIRKNLKKHEALELATGEDTSAAFWPDIRREEYAARIDRHLKKSTRRTNPASSNSQVFMTLERRPPPRRLRAPDTLETVEAATYYLRIYIIGKHETESWFSPGPFFGEQEAFSALFVRGLEILSRNDQQQQALAFKDINRAFDYLKPIVERNHPMLYMKLMAAIAAFAQYPKSEICSTICRLLSDHVRKLTGIVHGPHHPLNHIWGEAMHASSAGDPGSFVLGVAVSGLRKCMLNRPRRTTQGLQVYLDSRQLQDVSLKQQSLHIGEYVSSHARDLDEASLRANLKAMGARPDLLPQVQETRLALSELLLSQGRIPEGYHFYTLAMAFQKDDPVNRAGKTFWAAELKWRVGNTWGTLDTLKFALEYAEIECVDGEGNENAEKLRDKIEEVLCHRHNLLVLMEKRNAGLGGRRKCPVINF